MKLSEKLDRLRRVAPLGPSRYGQLYARKSDLSRRYKRVVMHTLFRSEENTHLLRPHLFKKDEGKTPAEWADWFSRNLTEVHIHGVLIGIGLRTGKHWTVQRILGWVGDVKYSTRHSPAPKRRHKTKRSRRARG